MERTITTGTLTPEASEKLIELNTYKDQRKLDKRYVKQLVSRQKKGAFTSARIAVGHILGKVAGYEGNEDFLLDGAHTAHATIESGGEFPCTFEHYFFSEGEDTHLDISRVFTSFNSGKPNSRADIVAIFAAHAGIDLPKQVLSTCGTALAWLESANHSVRGMDKEEVAELVITNRDAVEWVGDLFVSAHRDNRKHLKMAGVVAAMIAHYRVNRSDAELFWTRVRDGVDMEVGSPEYVLRRFLVDRAAGGNNSGPWVKANGDDLHRMMYSKCVHAINAHRERTATRLKYTPSAPIPKLRGFA